ncbi:hypothetical protein D3C77_582450 [compost metagenome]
MGRGKPEIEGCRWFWLIPKLHQHALEGNFPNPQTGAQAQFIFQRDWGIEGQAPWPYHRTFFVDVRRTQLQLQGVEFVFDQMQGEGHLVVVELRLQGDLLLGNELGQQVLDLGAAIDHQARRRLSRRRL